MTDQSRVWKVLVMLLASMTVGTIVLMSLGSTAPGSGAFSLASYYQLPPLDQVIASNSRQHRDRWEQIEIVYGQPHLRELGDVAKLNSHFVLCNGQGGNFRDGQIQKTECWKTQASTQPQSNWGATTKTIVILMVVDDITSRPTNNQWKRAELLVEALRHNFDIIKFSRRKIIPNKPS